MTLDLTWYDAPPEDGWPLGAAFPAPYRHDLSRHYLEKVAASRPPIMVMLPMRGGTLPHHVVGFTIDAHPTGKPDGAWQVIIVGELVAGAKPDITVKPSINCVGLYHGFVTNGTISDDIGD